MYFVCVRSLVTSTAAVADSLRRPMHVQLVTEHDLINRSQMFEQAIAGGDKQVLQTYCHNKVQGSQVSAQRRASHTAVLALLFWDWILQMPCCLFMTE